MNVVVNILAHYRWILRRIARHAKLMFALAAAAPLLSGCHYALLDPKGPIGSDERSIIFLATALMLVIVVPVIAMTLVFAWRFRASNTKTRYAPDWTHSNKIEAVVWLVPCVIVAVLAVVTWTTTHKLDPYRQIATTTKAVPVDVVSLDWKWLFIYPEQGVASVNELAMPVGTPVRFHLTSATVMNSFFIPRLGSQIYTMSGMETKLSLLADAPGNYEGISANYSGNGFSHMTFTARAMSAGDFAQWVSTARATHRALTLAAYHSLAKPSEDVPVSYYATVAPTLYHDILNQCTDGSPCTDALMRAEKAKRSADRHIAMAADTRRNGS